MKQKLNRRYWRGIDIERIDTWRVHKSNQIHSRNFLPPLGRAERKLGKNTRLRRTLSKSLFSDSCRCKVKMDEIKILRDASISQTSINLYLIFIFYVWISEYSFRQCYYFHQWSIQDILYRNGIFQKLIAPGHPNKWISWTEYANSKAKLKNYVIKIIISSSKSQWNHAKV